MRSECIKKVEEHLSTLAGKEVKLSEADVRRIDRDFLGEQQRMRAEDPAKWASMSTAERVEEAAKRVMANKARETRQKQLKAVSNELGLTRGVKQLESNAERYEGAGKYAQAAHDYVEGVAQQVRGAQVNASQGMDAIYAEALRVAEQAGNAKSDTKLWLLFGSRKSDAVFEDVVRAVMGEKVENAGAAAYAKAWSAKKEEQRQLMNRNGGNIGYLDHYMEAMHNPRIMQKVGREKWVSFWMENGDWKRIRHPSGEDWGYATAHEEGGKFTGDIRAAAELEKRTFLREAFRTMVTGGVNKTILEEIGDIREEAVKAAKAGGSGAGKGADLTKSPGHRLLHLKDADAIIAYNKQFSDKSLGAVFADSLERGASDAALVSIAGANPNQTIARVLETAKVKDEAHANENNYEGDYEVDPDSGWTKGGHRKIGADVFGWGGRTPDHAFNTLFRPSDKPGPIDAVLSTYSAIKAATSLLFTPVRAVWQDTEQILEHAQHVLGTGELKLVHEVMTESAKAVKNPENRAELNRFGIAMGATLDMQREYGARLTVENSLRRKDKIKLAITNAATRAAAAQQKYSLLQSETRVNRFGGETINALGLADYIKRDWASLKPSEQDMLSRAGFDKNEWHLYQQMPTADFHGAQAIETAKIHDHDAFAHMSEDERFRLANTVTGFIRAGGDITTSEFNFQAKTMTGALGNTGTAKQLMLFKNAPVTQSINLARRLERMDNVQRAKFGTKVIFRGVALGYIALSATAVLHGEKVPDPADPKTWLKSLLVSGGLSMVADFIDSALDPEDDSGHSSSMIPMLSDIQNLGTMTYYGTMGLAHTVTGNPEGGEELNKAGYRLLKFTTQQLPFLNYWYTKAAFGRLLLDDMAESVNPGYKKRLNRYAEESGTPYFWKPGEAVPTESPLDVQHRKGNVVREITGTE